MPTLHRKAHPPEEPPSQFPTLRVVVVEDSPFFRELLTAFCGAPSGLELAGATDSGVRGLDFAKKKTPELMLIDLQLPDADGLDLTAKLKALPRPPAVIIVSAFCDPYTVHQSLRVQIDGFVDKQADSLTILQVAIQAVREGRRYYSSSFLRVRAGLRQDACSFSKILSEWECEVLRHISHGLTDEEIGRDHLGISPRTVQTHRSNILIKLGIKNTPKLIAYAIENGFLRPQLGISRINPSAASGDHG